jgi:PAS domain S-box-containing protein
VGAAFDADLAAAVVRETPEAIVVADPAGTIVLWNGGATRIFGYSEAEAIGATLDLIIPEKLRARHWEGYEKTMATGQTTYGDSLLKVPATHKDGRRMSIGFSVALLRSPGSSPGPGSGSGSGEVTGIAAIIRDVTQSWQEERQLRSRIAELEAGQSTAGPTGSPPRGGVTSDW